MTPETLEKEVRAFLARNFPLGEDVDALASHDSLQQAGIIDSTAVLELVEFVEERFGIAIPDEDLLPEHLDSVAGVVAYVQSRAGS